MAVIIFENVTKIFNQDIIGVQDLSFEIEKGEFVFLVGRNGAGKSTFLKLLTTQLLPTVGDIIVEGESIGMIKRNKIPYFRRKFGIMEKDVGLLNDRTLYDNIAFAMIATGQPKKLIESRVGEVLGVVGLRKMYQQYPSELSGGEVARALLARALVINPHIIVADEPTANLDSDASWDFMCLLDDISRQGITVIIASHDRELVTVLKKRVITLADGKIIKDEKKGRYDTRIIESYDLEKKNKR
jgi:cell division transport system ATP-binding protein